MEHRGHLLAPGHGLKELLGGVLGVGGHKADEEVPGDVVDLGQQVGKVHGIFQVLAVGVYVLAQQGNILIPLLHQLPHLVHRLYVRHHQAPGAHVQHLQNRRTGHVLHPHQGRAVPGGQGRDGRQGALHVRGSVLRVHDGKVHTGDADALGRGDAAQLVKGAQGVLAPQKLLPQQIVHAFASSLFPSRTWFPLQIR